MKLYTRTRAMLRTFALALLAAGVVSAQDGTDLGLGEPPAHPQAKQDAADGVNAFAFDLYRELTKGKQNLLFSPYSISSALGMTYAGARGETRAQIQRALHFSADEAQVHEGFRRLNASLVTPALRCGPTAPANLFGGMADALGGDAPSSSPTAPDAPTASCAPNGALVRIANRLWPQVGFPIEPAFERTARDHYSAPVEPLDFAADPDAAKDTINQWVGQQTLGADGTPMIPELLKSLTDDTKLVLTNAIYFAAEWETAFDDAQTQDGAFFLPGGSIVMTPMMNADEVEFRATFEPDLEATVLELPYRGGDLSLVAIYGSTPDALPAIEAALTPAKLEAALRTARDVKQPLSMPKFAVESEFQLEDALRALGVTDAFSELDADLGGIADAPGLHVSKVVHKAAASFDEQGAEAAAATAAVVVLESAFVGYALDRPFVYLIRDTKTGAILFMGRMLDPTK